MGNGSTSSAKPHLFLTRVEPEIAEGIDCRCRALHAQGFLPGTSVVWVPHEEEQRSYENDGRCDCQEDSPHLRPAEQEPFRTCARVIGPRASARNPRSAILASSQRAFRQRIRGIHVTFPYEEATYGRLAHRR